MERLPQTDAERIAAVKAAAEALMACRGSVACTYTDFGFTATARRGEETTVVRA